MRRRFNEGSPVDYIHSSFSLLELRWRGVGANCVRLHQRLLSPYFIWFRSETTATEGAHRRHSRPHSLILLVLNRVFVANTADLHRRRNLHSLEWNKLLSTPRWDTVRVRRLKKLIVCWLRVKSPGKYLVYPHGCHFMKVFLTRNLKYNFNVFQIEWDSFKKKKKKKSCL